MSVQHDFDFLIQWHLTERCNLRCTHCYQGGSPGSELTPEEVREGIAEIADLFAVWKGTHGVSVSPSFNITGGEPFLRSDLFSILEELQQHGFPVFLLTNGILVDRERARMLAGLGVQGVQVSVEGPPAIHDAIRGAGSFERSAAGIEHLLDAGLTVTLNVTVSDLNAPYLKNVVAFASHTGVQRLGFSRLVPSGRASALVGHMLPPHAVKELYARLFSLDVRNLEIVTGDPVAAQMRQLSQNKKGSKKNKDRADDQSLPLGGCAAGVSGLTILADGAIVPCRRLPIPVGNLRRDALREVWSASPVLEALRDKSRYRGKCGSCSRWNSCRGCRAIAYAYAQSRGSDDFLGEDPQCFLDEAGTA